MERRLHCSAAMTWPQHALQVPYQGGSTLPTMEQTHVWLHQERVLFGFGINLDLGVEVAPVKGCKCKEV